MKAPTKIDPISSGPSEPETQELSSQDIATLDAHDIATPVKQGTKRLHKATFASDKKNGGYLIRVQGPTPNVFAGKIVPVVKMNDDESAEALERLVWFGKDAESGIPVALYTFTQKPRKDIEPIF